MRHCHIIINFINCDHQQIKVILIFKYNDLREVKENFQFCGSLQSARQQGIPVSLNNTLAGLVNYHSGLPTVN